jgi:uncharacterized membrane protein (UPF0136 family)
MRSKKHSLSDMLQETSNSFAEITDHPLRQAQEMFGGAAAERWTVNQVQFSEDARMAARRALWYLRLVEIDSDDTLRRHVQEKAHGQLDAIKVPRDASELCQPGDDEKKCQYTGAIEPRFSTLVEIWDDLVSKLGVASTLSYDECRDIERCASRFIKRSRPLDPFLRFTYSFAPAMSASIVQHLGIIIAFLVGLTVCAGVEAARSILMNDPGLTLLVFIAALAPTTVLGIAQRVLRRQGKSAPWNRGGRVVHSWPVSEQPERWQTWHTPGYAAEIYFSLLLKFVLHVVLWVFLGLLLKGAIGILAADGIWLTVYLIVLLWAFVVLLGGLVDFADMHSQSPLRGMMVGGAAFVGIALVLTDSDAAMGAAIAVWLALMVWWSLRVRNVRASSVPVTVAVITLWAIGTTSARQRDDVWRPRADSSRPLQPDEWPLGDRTSGPVVVIAASGGGSRAAIFTAKTLTALDASAPDVSANLQAISSVSGGSLANAAYIARRMRSAAGVKDSVQPCLESLSAAMTRDFIQPTLLGLVRKGGRGRAIQDDWEQCPVGLANVSIDKLANAWRDAKANNRAAPFPIPLFNSTTLERNGVVISPLDQRLFSSVFDAEARVDTTNQYRQTRQPTWVFYRSGIYHLSDLLGSMDAPLSAAVRASANFPFGFPLVEVESRKHLWYSMTMSDTAFSDTTSHLVRLTDGGALSNSGMWPLVPLLVNQREHIGSNRGVLMIIVDASRMPGAPWTDRQRGLLATLMDKNPTGERLHYQMLEELEAEYGDCFGYAYIGIEPHPKYNVYTTWALDRGSLQIVDSAFANAWKTAQPQIKSEYARLQHCENSHDNPRKKRIHSPRVPLS